MPDDKDFLLENIEKLVYKITDIGHILHSHGHIEHIGATKDFVDMSGAKTYIGKGDEDTVAGRNGLQWTNEFKMEYTGAFEADVIISDGDRITIGNRELYFISTLGHTAGTLSIQPLGYRKIWRKMCFCIRWRQRFQSPRRSASA